MQLNIITHLASNTQIVFFIGPFLRVAYDVARIQF